MESVGKAGHTVTEGNSSSLSFTRSIELTPGLSSQSLEKSDILWLQQDCVKSENLLICIVDKEGEQTNRAAHKDHPDNSVKKVFSIHKVSDAMNGWLL